MARYYGGQAVKEGFYLDRSILEFVPIGRGGGILPGDKGTRYSRLPLPAAMTIAPLTGLAFIIFLPLVGVVAVIGLLIYGVWQSVKLVGRKAHSTFVGRERDIVRLTGRGTTLVPEEAGGEIEGKPAELSESRS